MPPFAAAVVANNYAWACYMLGDAASLEVAERESARAHQLGPQLPFVLGTRGAVLVARGEIRAGRALLERSLKLQQLRVARAVNLAVLALAALLDGDAKSARKLLDRARQLDADCELLPRVEQQLHRSDRGAG